MVITVYDRVENIVGTGEKMLVTSIFLVSRNIFKRLLRMTTPSSMAASWFKYNNWQLR